MNPVRNLCRYAAIAAVALGSATAVFAAPVDPPPPLAAPSGTIVNVSTVSQLRTAISNLKSNTTIVLAPGTYTLTDALWINGTFSNIGIRGATNNRDDVVLAGGGWNNSAVQFGIWTGGSVQGVTIANLTIRDVYYHAINFNAGTETPLVYNVRLANSGQQLLKSNADSSGGGVDNGIIEYSVVEYSTTSRDDYTNGVDVHAGKNWIIRNNLFRNIKAPSGALAGPALLMWNNASNTTVEGNTFINCQREIALGLIDRGSAGNDHTGGIVRNNFIYRTAGMLADAAIGVGDSPNTQVVHNTILVSGTYSQPIEYRFSGSTGVVIRNNLVDGNVVARDGASGTASNNVSSSSAMFVNAAAGDLHLKSTATTAIDKAAALTNAPQDWDREARPSGSAPDIGADEYRGTSTTPPAPGAPTNLRIIR